MSGGSILSCCSRNPHAHERALKEGKKRNLYVRNYSFMCWYSSDLRYILNCLLARIYVYWFDNL